MFRIFDPDNLSKPYFCVIHCNGYKCFVFKEHGVAGELLKTTIEFIYQVEEINYLIGVYELESTSSVSKLWFEDELIASKCEQSPAINNYLPILQECTRILSSCWSAMICLEYCYETKEQEMKLLVKFDPVKVTGATKEHVKASILKTRFVCTFRKNVNFFIDRVADNSYETSRSTVRLFCLEKRRKKVQRVIKDGKTVSSKVISKGHWVGHYYDIPYDLILSLVS